MFGLTGTEFEVGYRPIYTYDVVSVSLILMDFSRCALMRNEHCSLQAGDRVGWA